MLAEKRIINNLQITIKSLKAQLKKAKGYKKFEIRMQISDAENEIRKILTL